MKYLLILTLTVFLLGCSTLSALIPALNPGLQVQAGVNDNQVETGVGSIGNSKHSLDITDSDHVTVDAATGKYHIQSDKDLTVNVYETNKWIYGILAFYLIGQPLLKWWWSRRKQRNELDANDGTLARSNSNGDMANRRSNR